MKKLLTILLLFCLNANATNYYFSTTGSDANNGTSISTTWKTLAKFNSVFASLQPGDSVLFKRGDTFYGSLTISRSGSAGLPITIGAYGSGARPIITGLATLVGWVSTGSGIYESYNPSLGAGVNTVTINGVAQQIGRYPNADAANKGYLTFESHGASSITDNQLTASPNWTGAEMVVRTLRWVIDRTTITSHSGTTLSYSPALTYTPTDGYGYFIQNDIRTLDQFGEWYYNPSTKKMNVYFGGNAPSSYTVEASATSDLVSLSGNQSNITFDNLTFKGANSNGFNISSNYSTNFYIKNCDILFSGKTGVLATAASNLKIEYCTLANSNSHGVYSIATASNVTVRYCTFSNTGTRAGMGENGNVSGTSILIWVGANHLIEYNTIDSSGYAGINYQGNSTIVRNNFITNFCFVKDDGGAIYTGNGGYTPTYTGQQIINNIILNGIGAGEGTNAPSSLSAEGIYMDNWAANATITGNTIANCGDNGMLLHNAFGMNIQGNTFFDCGSSAWYLSDRADHLINGLTVNNNIFFAKTATQLAARFYAVSGTNNIPTFGTFDNNYYCRPILETNCINVRYPNWSTTNTNVTLSEWKTLFGKDANSNKSPKTITDVNDLRFEYNATSSNKTVSLPYNYIDVKGVVYNGTITLAPYTSAVLIKNGAFVPTEIYTGIKGVWSIEGQIIYYKVYKLTDGTFQIKTGDYNWYIQ